MKLRAMIKRKNRIYGKQKPQNNSNTSISPSSPPLPDTTTRHLSQRRLCGRDIFTSVLFTSMFWFCLQNVSFFGVMHNIQPKKLIYFSSAATNKNENEQEDAAGGGDNNNVIQNSNEPLLLSTETVSLSYFETNVSNNSQNASDCYGIARPKKLIQQLTPPFRILQVGQGRSGSTFQITLLRLIAKMKTPPNKGKMLNKYFHKSQHEQFLREIKNKDNSFAIKAHNEEFIPMAVNQNVNINIFVSISSYDYDGSGYNLTTKINEYPNEILYIQKYDNFRICSLCEIDQYRDIFGLTNQEIWKLREHMKYWEILRKCCGHQASKYHMAMVNGCNMTPYQHLPEYPWCEHYNISHVELQYCQSSLSNCYRSPFNKDMGGFYVPGDCKRIDTTIREQNLGFNSHPFQGCSNLQNRRNA